MSAYTGARARKSASRTARAPVCSSWACRHGFWSAVSWRRGPPKKTSHFARALSCGVSFQPPLMSRYAPAWVELRRPSVYEGVVRVEEYCVTPQGISMVQKPSCAQYQIGNALQVM